MKTKTLVTIFFILLVSVCLFSCGSKILMEKQEYYIKSIEEYSNKLCTYNISTGVDNNGYIDNISIIDTIGKFAIGDTVSLSSNKH